MKTRRRPACEPVRVLMEQPLPKAAALAFSLVLAAAFFAAVRAAFSETGAENVIALVSALSAFALIAGLSLRLRDRSLMVMLCAAGAVLLALWAHLTLLSVRPGRMTRVIAPLLDELWNYDLPVAMAWEPGSWSGGYLVVMALFSRLENFPAVYAVKLLDLFCLAFAALAAAGLASRRGAGDGGVAAAAALSLLLPTALLNAGLWAQCDAVFAAFALWGLLLILEGRPLAGSACLGLALAFKLQSAFLFPLLIPLFFRGRIGLRHLAAVFLCFLLPHVPMLAQGQGLASVLGRYNAQILTEAYGDLSEDEEEPQEQEAEEPEQETAEEQPAEEAPAEPAGIAPYDHEGLSDHAPGVYQLMTVASVREFSGMGLYLAIACALLTAFALLRARADSADAWLTAAFLLCCGLPLVLPQMNARCLYLAGLISLCRLDRPLRAAQAALTEFISLAAYLEAIFSTDAKPFAVVPMPVLSLLLISVAVSAAAELAVTLGYPGKEDADETGR